MANSLEERLKALDEAKLKLIHSALEDKEDEINQLIHEATEKLRASVSKGEKHENE